MCLVKKEDMSVSEVSHSSAGMSSVTPLTSRCGDCEFRPTGPPHLSRVGEKGAEGENGETQSRRVVTPSIGRSFKALPEHLRARRDRSRADVAILNFDPPVA